MLFPQSNKILSTLSSLETMPTAVPKIQLVQASIDEEDESHIWHATRVDYLELAMGKKLRSSVYKATSARFNSTIVVKFARFPGRYPFSVPKQTPINGSKAGKLDLSFWVT